MRLFRPGFIAGWLYPDALFRLETTEKELCLTFDDGPDPDSTPQLLDILDSHDIKCIFFCKGKAAERYPDLIGAIKTRGHLLGNHGYDHLDGWKTSPDRYFEDINRSATFTDSRLFRPPFGRLRLSQYNKLRIKYKIFFWDIMPYDFDKSFGAANSVKILLKKLRPGSIIVLHDNPQSAAGYLIDQFVSLSVRNGYKFVLPGLSA